MDTLLLDLRSALRSLLHRPGLTLAVVLSLALVIGANTTVFSYVSFLLWQDLPVHDPDRLVQLTARLPEGDRQFSYPDYVDLREHGSGGRGVLSDLSAQAVSSATIDGGAGTVHAWTHLVSGNYFTLLGSRALHGRTLVPEDDRPGAEPAIVLSHGFWRRSFGGDPGVVGRTLRVNGTPFTVAGVMPLGFLGASFPGEVYVALAQESRVRTVGRDTRGDRTYEWLALYGRLRPGVEPAAAEEALGAVAARLHSETPELRIVVQPSGKVANPEVRAFLLPAAWKTMVFVSLLLLLACANVANLLISAMADRIGDLGVRVAVGASRWSLIRGLVAESLLLAAAGGLLGILLAAWGTRLIETHLATQPAGLGHWSDGWGDLPLDLRVLGFTLLLCLATGFLSGLLPALHASSQAVLLPALKGNPQAVTLGGRGRSVSRFGGRFGGREILVVVQVALSASLLAGAGLFARSLGRIYDVDPGFRSEALLLSSVSITDRPGQQGGERRQEYRDLVADIGAIPGVAASTLVWHVPLAGLTRPTPLRLPGDLPDAERLTVTLQVVGTRYFETFGIPRLQGRDFDRRDVESSPPVAVVSEELARRLWPGEEAVGRLIRTASGAPGQAERDVQVIGVVGDTRQESLWHPAVPTVYLPFEQSFRRRMTLVARAQGDPVALLPAVRDVLGQREDVAVIDLMPFSAHVARSLGPQRMNVMTVVIFGGLGLALASLGIASAMSSAVSRRRREIGIRMALGETPGSVLRGVLGRALGLIAVGAVLGLGATLASARLLAGFVLGVETVPEPLVLAAVAMVLFGVGSAASWHPARRAARVNPMVALKGR
jgi:predicted permease